MPALHKGYSSGLIKKVERTITSHEMFQPGESVLVGVSGGPDSVALLHILLTLAPRYSLVLAVAHLNHGLRGRDSDHDADFVASLAAKYGLPFYTTKKDVYKYKLKHKVSLEEAARCVRYRFYDRVLKQGRFDKIALGHHQDDNAELILMYLFRGSGPLGLSGIPPVREGKIVRPLIGVNRTEIVNYLAANGLPYVTDASNSDTRYLRNKIRHDFIPAIQMACNPRLAETLSRLSAIMKAEDEWVGELINPIFEAAVLADRPDRVTLSVPRLSEIHVAAKRRVIRKAVERVKGSLRRIAFSHIDAAVRLTETGSADGKLDLPEGIRIERRGSLIDFCRVADPRLRRRKGPAGTEPISFEYRISESSIDSGALFIKEINGELRYSRTDGALLPDIRHGKKQVAFLDMDNLVFPLLIRNFRPGDRFRPLGMHGTQKVKKFFINQKVSRSERRRCPIILDSEKIIWVAGFRIDDSVKVNSSTRKVLKMELFLA